MAGIACVCRRMMMPLVPKRVVTKLSWLVVDRSAEDMPVM